VHRRSLPIAEPCQVFRPRAGHTFCGKCEKHVHDISAMTKREASRFLAANAGKSICIAYRAAKDGTILVRPEPRAIGVVLIALGLAACAGYAPEIERHGDECRDDSGYVIDCKTATRNDLIVLADEVPVGPSGRTEPDRIEPIRPDADVGVPVDYGSLDMVGQMVPTDEGATPPQPNLEIDEGDEMAGTMMIDENIVRRIAHDDRRTKREARREARRERRAARGR
jgi:hypothetical protein